MTEFDYERTEEFKEDSQFWKPIKYFSKDYSTYERSLFLTMYGGVYLWWTVEYELLLDEIKDKGDDITHFCYVPIHH